MLKIKTLILSFLFLFSTLYLGSQDNPKPTFQSFIMTVELYDQDMWVVITEDTSQALHFVREVMDDTTISSKEFDCRGITFLSDKQPACMWLPRIPNNPEELAVANHEIFHLTRSIMIGVGIPLSDESEEAWAYVNQNISKQFYQNVIRLKRKK